MPERAEFSAQIRELTDRHVEPSDRTKAGQEYRAFRQEVYRHVKENPTEAENVVWFIFQNKREVKHAPLRYESIGAIKTLAEMPGHQDKAVELLGLAMQDVSPKVVQAAKKALWSFARRKLATN